MIQPPPVFPAIFIPSSSGTGDEPRPPIVPPTFGCAGYRDLRASGLRYDDSNLLRLDNVRAGVPGREAARSLTIFGMVLVETVACKLGADIRATPPSAAPLGKGGASPARCIPPEQGALRGPAAPHDEGLSGPSTPANPTR